MFKYKCGERSGEAQCMKTNRRI